MGVFYLVEPLDDEQREWLEAEGVALPSSAARSRNPTPAEIREVCDALPGFRVGYNASAKNKFWQANVTGIKGRDRNRGTLLNIDNWGGSEQRRYKITFEKGDPDIILQIVQGLSAHCGPLVVIPDSGDTPAVLWPDANPKKLLRNWGADE
jgi:hypothetical protein